MNFPWALLVDLGIISAALLLATVIRARVRFFQRFLIPNALTAGFFLLLFYNFAAPPLGLSADRLGVLVYHLLSISYIAMTLRREEGAKNTAERGIMGTSAVVISQFGLQVVTGLLLTFLFMSTVIPDLFPSFGLLLSLGFAQGPGQAYAIGHGWEGFGFNGAGSIGLTFAAVGFLWACFGGMFLINYGIKRGWLSRAERQGLERFDAKSGVHPPGSKLPVGARLTTESEAIDSMTFNLGMVLFIYLLCYLVLHLITYLLSLAGDLGRDLAVNLWALSFVFAAITALAVKKLLALLKVDHTLDNGTLTRLSGASVDLMVAGALGAISLVIVAEYWLPILTMALVSGLLTMVTVLWLCSRVFVEHRLHRALLIFGSSTGTMPTGLALLRVIDPQFESPAASDYMYQAPFTFVIVIPLILSINLPVYSATEGRPELFWLMVAIALGYLLLSLILFVWVARKRAFKNAGRVWLPAEPE